MAIANVGQKRNPFDFKDRATKKVLDLVRLIPTAMAATMR